MHDAEMKPPRTDPTSVGVTLGLVLALVVLMVGAAWLVASGPADDGACDATVYEGCPERWEYLWAGDD